MTNSAYDKPVKKGSRATTAEYDRHCIEFRHTGPYRPGLDDIEKNGLKAQGKPWEK